MGRQGERRHGPWPVIRECWERLTGTKLTLDGEEHGLADVGAHAVAGLAEVVADVLFQDVADQQRAVWQDLDAAGEGHRVVLLRVPAPCKEAEESRTGGRVRSELGGSECLNERPSLSKADLGRF